MAGEASMLPLLLLTWCTLCLGKRRSLLRHPTVVHWQDDPEGYVLSTERGVQPRRGHAATLRPGAAAVHAGARPRHRGPRPYSPCRSAPG